MNKLTKIHFLLKDVAVFGLTDCDAAIYNFRFDKYFGGFL
jgi:hypothetical protein